MTNLTCCKNICNQSNEGFSMKNNFYQLLLVTILCFINPIDLQAASQKNASSPPVTPQPGSHAFSIHDTDLNGSLSREEYDHFVEQIEIRRKATGRPMRRLSTLLSFEDIDNNNDGLITEDEMTRALNRRLQKHRRYRYRGKQ